VDRLAHRVAVDIGVVDEVIARVNGGLEGTYPLLNRGCIALGFVSTSGDPHRAITEAGNFNIGGT
jgi:hypothetical protein